MTPTHNEDKTIYWYGDNVLMERHSTSDRLQFLWNVYVREPVTGDHPIHGSETTEEYVWVQKGQGDEAHAHELCEQLAGH